MLGVATFVVRTSANAQRDSRNRRWTVLIRCDSVRTRVNWIARQFPALLAVAVSFGGLALGGNPLIVPVTGPSGIQPRDVAGSYGPSGYPLRSYGGGGLGGVGGGEGDSDSDCARKRGAFPLSDHPVSLADGRKIETTTDLVVPIAGQNFRVTRSFTTGRGLRSGNQPGEGLPASGWESSNYVGTSWSLNTHSFIWSIAHIPNPVINDGPVGATRTGNKNGSYGAGSAVETKKAGQPAGPTDQYYTNNIATIPDPSLMQSELSAGRDGSAAAEFHQPVLSFVTPSKITRQFYRAPYLSAPPFNCTSKGEECYLLYNNRAVHASLGHTVPSLPTPWDAWCNCSALPPSIDPPVGPQGWQQCMPPQDYNVREGRLAQEIDAAGNRFVYEYTDESFVGIPYPLLKAIWLLDSSDRVQGRVTFEHVSWEGQTPMYPPSIVRSVRSIRAEKHIGDGVLVETDRIVYYYQQDYTDAGWEWADAQRLGTRGDLVQVVAYRRVDAQEGAVSEGLPTPGLSSSPGPVLSAPSYAASVAVTQYRYYSLGALANQFNNGLLTCEECKIVDPTYQSTKGATHGGYGPGQLRIIVDARALEVYAQSRNAATSSRLSLIDRCNEFMKLAANQDVTLVDGTRKMAQLCTKIIAYRTAGVSNDMLGTVGVEYLSGPDCGCSGSAAGGVHRTEVQHWEYAPINSPSIPLPQYSSTTVLTESVFNGSSYEATRVRRYDMAVLELHDTGFTLPYPESLAGGTYYWSPQVLVNDVTTIGDKHWVKHYVYQPKPQEATTPATGSSISQLLRVFEPSACASYIPGTSAGARPQYMPRTTVVNGEPGAVVRGYAYTQTGQIKEMYICGDGFGPQGSQSFDFGVGRSLSDPSFSLVESREYFNTTGFAQLTRKPKKITRYVTGSSSGPTESVEMTYGLYANAAPIGGSYQSGFATSNQPINYNIAWSSRSRAMESISQNGPSSSTNVVEVVIYDTRGRVLWEVASDGARTRFVYDDGPVGSGEVVQIIQNAPGLDQTIADALHSTLWATLQSAGVATDRAGEGGSLTTQILRDAQGDVVMEISPSGVATHIREEMRSDPMRPGLTYLTTVRLPHKLGASDFAGPAVVERTLQGGGQGTQSRYAVSAMTIASAPAPLSAHPVSSYTLGAELGRQNTVLNEAGQVVKEQRWHDINAAPYETEQAYDSRGRLVLTVSPTGEAQRFVYDALDRLIGMDETSRGSQTIAQLLASNSFTRIADYFYDGGTASNPLVVGDGLRTMERRYLDGTSVYRDTVYEYDNRNRRIKTIHPLSPVEVLAYDNLDRVVSRSLYDSTQSFAHGNRFAYHETSYNSRGMVYRQRTAIDPNAAADPGSQGYLETHTWFDKVGRVVASWGPNAPGQKLTYDGLGRVVTTYVTDRGGDPAPGISGSWEAAMSVSGDTILERTDTRFVAGAAGLAVSHAGLPDLVTMGKRTDGGSHLLETYMATVYDAADRPIRSIDFGVNSANDVFEYVSPGGSAPTASEISTPPTYAIVSHVSYNERGLAGTVTDPDGSVTKYAYDDLDRTVAVIENYVSGTVTRTTGNAWGWQLAVGGNHQADQDRTTISSFDGDDRQTHYVAAFDDGTGVSYQRTEYHYGVSPSSQAWSLGNVANTIDSVRLLSKVVYPDAADGSHDNSVQYRYNAQGEIIAMRDQNGTVRQFVRDGLGRMTEDRVTEVGSGVDSTVRTLKSAFDGRGLLSRVTSLPNSNGTGTPINEVTFDYDDLLRITAVAQNPLGAVTTSSPPQSQGVVQYTYSTHGYTLSDPDNYSRETALTYPAHGSATRTVVARAYGSSASLDHTISRLSAMTWNGPIGGNQLGTHTASFSYVGASTPVVRQMDVPALRLDRVIDPDTGATATDRVQGLDRFGRVKRQLWVPVSNISGAWKWSSTVPDGSAGRYAPPLADFGYSYSPGGDVLTRTDLRANGRALNPDRDERYAYNGLHQLVQADRGRLAGNPATFTHGGAGGQQWDLDALGNWKQSITNLNGAGGTIIYDPDVDPLGGISADRVDQRKFNAANEMVGPPSSYDRKLHEPASTPNGPADLSLGQSAGEPYGYDRNGNLVKKHVLVPNGPGAYTLSEWKYTYDAWNRLVRVAVAPYAPEPGPHTSAGTLRAAYTYNGLNWRVTRTADANADLTLDEGSLYYYDSNWRLLEERIDLTYTGSWSIDRFVQRVWAPTYIDELVYFHTDSPTPAPQDPGGLGEEEQPQIVPADGDFANAKGYYALVDRMYGVIAITDIAGAPQERVRYSPYGVARHFNAERMAAMGDVNGDGVIDFTDFNRALSAYNAGGTLANTSSSYDPDCDFDRDGDVDVQDFNRTNGSFGLTYAMLPDGVLSMQTIGSTVGYSGYVFDGDVDLYCVRNRWLDASTGQWLSRDPLDYVDGMNTLQYCRSSPLDFVDPTGLMTGCGTYSQAMKWSASEKLMRHAKRLGFHEAKFSGFFDIEWCETCCDNMDFDIAAGGGLELEVGSGEQRFWLVSWRAGWYAAAAGKGAGSMQLPGCSNSGSAKFCFTVEAEAGGILDVKLRIPEVFGTATGTAGGRVGVVGSFEGCVTCVRIAGSVSCEVTGKFCGGVRGQVWATIQGPRKSHEWSLQFEWTDCFREFRLFRF